MFYSNLGSTDLAVSKLSLGCANLDLSNKLRSKKLLYRALDLGINFFDTASSYQAGKNEKLLGEVFQHTWKDIIVSTKIGYPTTIVGKSINKIRNQLGFDNHTSPSQSLIISQVEKSLRNLRSEYLDILFIHNPVTSQTNFDILHGVMNVLRDQGKVRYFGISFMTVVDYVGASRLSPPCPISIIPNAPNVFSLDSLVSSTGAIIRQPFSYLKNKDMVGSDSQEFDHMEVLNSLINFPSTQSIIFGTNSVQHLEKNVTLLKR